MWTKNIIVFVLLLQFIAVLCLVLSTNGAPQQYRRYGYRSVENSGPNGLAKVTNQGASIDTAFGNWKIIHIGSKV